MFIEVISTSDSLEREDSLIVINTDKIMWFKPDYQKSVPENSHNRTSLKLNDGTEHSVLETYSEFKKLVGAINKKEK